MQDAFDHCERLVHEADRDKFIATMFAPEERRPALFAIHAFSIELERVRELVSAPMPGEIRLQWWRDAVAGQGHGEVGAHPVAAALLQAMVQHGLPTDALQALIDARSFDLYDEPMQSLAELETYAADTRALRLAAAVLDGEAAAASAAALRHGAIAHGLTALLQALPWHAAPWQVLPIELLQRCGVAVEDVHARRATPALAAALAELRALARRHFAAMTEAGAPQALVPALLPVALVPAWLARLERAEDPFQPADFPRWRRQWRMWRAARRPIATWVK